MGSGCGGGGVWVVVMLVFMLAGVVCLVVIIVLCGGEPTNILQQLWSFLFLVSCVSYGTLVSLKVVYDSGGSCCLREGVLRLFTR